MDSKNRQTTHTWNFLTFPNYWLRIPLWNFFFNKFCLQPLTALLGHPVQKYFFLLFALIKKIYLKYFLDIIKKYFYIFGTPLKPKRRKAKISHMECWLSKQGKKGDLCSYLKEFFENIQKRRFLCWHFWKRSNFEAFFRPTTLKSENFSKII